MPRATCRCGQTLTIPADSPERVVCPQCGARVRVRPRKAATGDGYLRFICPCGRRLKVDAANPPTHGRCPDCDRVVPVPRAGLSPSASALPVDTESRTADLSPEDLARLEQWVESHRAQPPRPAPTVAVPVAVPVVVPALAPAPPPAPAGPSGTRTEAGLRICPGCRKPVHLGADVCRHCGMHVPKR